MKTKVINIVSILLVIFALSTVSAYADSDIDNIWFGTSASDSTALSSLGLNSGDNFDLYIYSTCSANLWGASYAMAFGNDFTFVGWSVNQSYLSYIGGVSSVAIDGLNTLADGTTKGYIFETGPIDKPAYTGLVGTLTLKNGVAAGAQGVVSLWTQEGEWTRATAIYDADTYGKWVGSDFTVKTTSAPVTAVPEPSSLLGLASGLISMGVFSFRKRQS